MGTTDLDAMDVRFIKLGEKGKWEKSCIEDDGTIRLGYESNQHQECLDKKWDEVRAYWLQERRGNASAATSDVRQIQAFYEMPASTLWITFYNRMLYWCHADEEVIEWSDKSRIRKAIGGWSYRSIRGEVLHVSNLDGRVTKVQRYQGTICEVERSDYLARKIRGEIQPEVRDARLALESLRQHAINLIAGLWWHDFELLVDLILVRAGWQRISVLGKTEKDVECDMLSPVTNKRAFIQIKSSADYGTFQESLRAFHAGSVYDEMYFFVHTARDDRIFNHAEDNVTIIGPSKAAELTINSGLMDWLIKRHE